jgi:hypothetical protein
VLVTAIEGVVENGKIVLSEHVPLAEKTKVYVIVADLRAASPAQIRSPRLANVEQAGDFRKRVVESSGDA